MHMKQYNRQQEKRKRIATDLVIGMDIAASSTRLFHG